MQEPIGCVCATAFDAPDRSGEVLIAQGAKRNVYVIGHQHPGAQFISGLPHSLPEGIRDDPGNVAPLQPSGSGRHRVEELVQFDPSSPQVTKYAEPGRQVCSRRRWNP